MKTSADDPTVAGFKSVVCYRTGLDVNVASNVPAEIEALRSAYGQFRLRANGLVRLKQKALNDFVVRMTLEVAEKHNKPGISFFLLLSRVTCHSAGILTPSRSSAISYRSWRRRHYANACESCTSPTTNCKIPSSQIRAVTRKLPVYAGGKLPDRCIQERVS